jgi:beta-hydroxylase
MASTVEKPTNLTNPRRAFVKKTGKKLVRKIAKFQSGQSTVPDTPKLSNEHFPFLKDFTDNWETIQAEAKEVLKFREVIPGFQDITNGDVFDTRARLSYSSP